MSFRIAIEISAIQGAYASSKIIRSYRYSRFGFVAMILNGVSPKEINKILDPVVPTLSLNIPGVKYIDIMAEMAVIYAISSARTIFFQTPLFQEIVQRTVIDFEGGEEGKRRRIISIPLSLGKRVRGSPQPISLLTPGGSLAR